jgi:hypothetical protein
MPAAIEIEGNEINTRYKYKRIQKKE